MGSTYAPGLIRDLSDDEARLALPLKWGAASADVLPAWVAEMDYAPAEPLTAALHRAVADGRFGYPSFGPGGELGDAYAGFAERRLQWGVDPRDVLPVVDVTAGLRLAIDVLSEPGPIVLPVPAYSPHHDIGEITGRGRVDLVLDPDAQLRLTVQGHRAATLSVDGRNLGELGEDDAII